LVLKIELNPRSVAAVKHRRPGLGKQGAYPQQRRSPLIQQSRVRTGIFFSLPPVSSMKLSGLEPVTIGADALFVNIGE
jgi:hypothetical protein